MKLSHFLASTILLAALTFSSFAQANDIEVISENVIFVGDVSEEEGKELVRNLEIYRSTIISLVGLKGRPDKKPLRVYGLKNGSQLGKFTNMRGIAGVYKQGLKGPIFATVTKGGFAEGQWASQVALHEYSHHVLHGMSADDYPRWYDEGFANYLSSFKIEGDVITIGAPVVDHGKSLRKNNWMNPETVFESILYYPRTRNISQFYGQSWLYVHYLQNHAELGKKLPEYLSNLKTGQEPLEAFESAYGLSPRDFHNLARDYWRENAFPVIQFKADDDLLNPSVKVRALGEIEAELAYADGERNFMSKRKAKSLKKTYDKLAKSIGETPDILVGQAHSALFLQDYDTAKTLASKALEKAPQNSDTLSIRGDVFYHELSDELFETGAQGKIKKGAIRTFPKDDKTKTVISYFEDALTVDPLDYTSVTHLVNLYGRSSLPVTSVGKMAADTMTYDYLTPHLVGEHMDLAYIHSRTGDMTQACAYFGIAKTRVDSYKDKKVNDDFARMQAFEAEHPNCE